MEKVSQVDSFNVDKIVKVSLKETGKSVLQSLDRFLRYLNENRPEILSEFVESLEMFYRNETHLRESIASKFPLEKMRQESGLSSDYDKILSSTLDFSFDRLGLPEGYVSSSQEVEVSAIGRIRATVVP
ncbi:MAG: hypothetical protein RTU30_15455, partial [Candidatus Thorarchaeota archaeon]